MFSTNAVNVPVPGRPLCGHWPFRQPLHLFVPIRRLDPPTRGHNEHGRELPARSMSAFSSPFIPERVTFRRQANAYFRAPPADDLRFAEKNGSTFASNWSFT